MIKFILNSAYLKKLSQCPQASASALNQVVQLILE